jgi:hypothetical protein
MESMDKRNRPKPKKNKNKNDVNSNKMAQREIADVEFSKEAEVAKVNPNKEPRSKKKVDVENNRNHIRNKQLY